MGNILSEDRIEGLVIICLFLDLKVSPYNGPYGRVVLGAVFRPQSSGVGSNPTVVTFLVKSWTESRRW